MAHWASEESGGHAPFGQVKEHMPKGTCSVSQAMA